MIILSTPSVQVMASVVCERGHQDMQEADFYVSDADSSKHKFLPRNGYCAQCGKLAFVCGEEDPFEVR